MRPYIPNIPRGCVGGALVGVVTLVLMMCLPHCGSSGGSSGSSSTTTNASSITQLPETSTLTSVASASGSLSASKSLAKAVSGTPPKLSTISSSNIDTYFWNGLLSTIAGAGSATASQVDAFWEGEGSCRMAETVGYSFEQIMQAGGSLCYLQNVPSAASDITIVSGSATVEQALTQAVANQITKINVVQSGESQTIFVKVYGTATDTGSSGYAADLWFCDDTNSVNGYEKVRLNSSAGELTITSTHSYPAPFGLTPGQVDDFVGIMTGSVTRSGSNFIYDTSKTRSGRVFYGPSNDSFVFIGSVSLDGNGLLTARNYQAGRWGPDASSQVFKSAVFANLTSDSSSMDNLAFTEAGFAVDSQFENTMTITGASEFQASYYVPVGSSALLTLAQAEDFSEDLYSGTKTEYNTIIAAKSDFSCSTTPDYVVSMDFSKPLLAAVQTRCENDFSNMQFCNSTAVNNVRNTVFASQQSLYGSCPTSFCKEGDNLACQKWADNNPNNNAGLTSSNAVCNSGCCATQ
ncbi:MAG: hypothetical protein COV45_06160 [Deltaproteobacteria bacterium CG11_big_fil_rev_8_21_14_0_20_47_16]|nr:MAG: hypothetical protein COV45_06160 [Deltaproteobacteria bacterium CG11_big_fil_rev_8_21_14_0_20_47_16]